ncbi:hypothetical protein EYR40_007240 [Pleurotus pulmonarius]|nr:hypothetical protein EYR36_003477 [Pleurotus pulmonarius]KAF4600130.1 hypothetical protein EYR40_007240 [Pleurotus pulmonarius]
MDNSRRETFQKLKEHIRGQVHLDDEPSFRDLSTIFNGNVVTVARAVACPVDAEDVSKIVVFCLEHNLSPSIKAGGYGTAGWAVGGDIIIDLHKLVDIDIEPPKSDGSFTSLHDVASMHSKGKQAVGSMSTVSSGKRRREEDVELRNYDSASTVVAGFLKGPLDASNETAEPPAVRRRLEEAIPATSMSREISGESNDSTSTLSSSNSGDSNVSITSTAATSQAPASPRDKRPSEILSGGDPFGYLNTSTSSTPAPATTRQSAFSQPSFSSWASTSTTLLANPNSPPVGAGFFQPPMPVHQQAFITFGSGLRQKEVDIFCAANPLDGASVMGVTGHVPYHVPFGAHPAGSSIMILGGFGFLSRMYGLSVDNLVEVEMVLADGRVVIVSENEHPDLWWAIRGGGPAFGIATRYKAKAYPVPVVFAGNIIYRFHKATAPSLIKHFRDCIKGAPRELYANIILTAGPAGKDSLVVIQMCYVGPKEKGQEYLAAISSWDGERCLLNEVDEKSFLHQQDSVAQVLRGKAGRQWFIRSSLISSLPDDIVNETVLQFADSPVGCTWLFELAGGAIADFENACIPKRQREASFTVAALHQWEMGLDDARCVEAAEEWIRHTLKPVEIGGPFPSFLGRHEPPSRTMSCFGESWARMKEVKQQYDPDNFFRHSYWPLNAAGETVDPSEHEPPTPPGANRISELVPLTQQHTAT